MESMAVSLAKTSMGSIKRARYSSISNKKMKNQTKRKQVLNINNIIIDKPSVNLGGNKNVAMLNKATNFDSSGDEKTGN
jgi:hypothetical protein